MLTILFIAAFLAFAPQSLPQQQVEPSQQQRMEQAQEKYEPARQAAIHVNELAGSIHSEADAREFVDAVSERLNGRENLSWTTRSIRHRIAHAEYQAVSDSSRLIPEQRVVDLWNEYVRELDAPEETLVTPAEMHNLRDGMYTGSQFMWKRGGFTQSLWTVPNIYAVGADGKVAQGCRAIEALKIFHDMSYSFPMVQGASDRVAKGVFVSDEVKQRQKEASAHPKATQAHATLSSKPNPVRLAEYRYVQAHGELDYQRLLERLFEELFPQ
jgi:hypothetical protein